MKFIHQREHLNEDDIVVIQCSQMCNIRLMNDANFRSFKMAAVTPITVVHSTRFRPASPPRAPASGTSRSTPSTAALSA